MTMKMRLAFSRHQPGFGGTQRLPRLVGITQALPVILRGKPLDVHKAFKIGLVDEVAYEILLRLRPVGDGLINMSSLCFVTPNEVLSSHDLQSLKGRRISYIPQLTECRVNGPNGARSALPQHIHDQ